MTAGQIDPTAVQVAPLGLFATATMRSDTPGLLPMARLTVNEPLGGRVLAVVEATSFPSAGRRSRDDVLNEEVKRLLREPRSA